MSRVAVSFLLLLLSLSSGAQNIPTVVAASDELAINGRCVAEAEVRL